MSKRSWLLLIVACVLVFCVNLGGARVLTDHEMDIGGGARQMLTDGDWLIPRLGDRTWLEKPPSLHWLAAMSMKISGSSDEWVIRMPSVLAGIGVVLLVALLVGWWMGEKAGLVAGLVQCTSLYVVTYARLAEADMLLAFNVVGALVVFVRLQGIGLDRPS
ncbi:MAG: glycosyltransferase family 39 protein, partial [Halioglobus sp.]|nr:glycosyltransferase family 39 protein [Halioglobus sp.]